MSTSQPPTFGDESLSLVLFEQRSVRRIWCDGRWFYSVIDAISVLTESGNSRRYWTDMKRRLAGEGFDKVYANCVQFKLPAPDGKLRETDCADTETLLRIIQSIPSPNAEPFKRWLAQVGADIIDDRTEDQKRITNRRDSRAINRNLHQEIHQRGIHEPFEHADFEDRGHRKLYGGESWEETDERRGVPSDEHYSWMGSEELADNIFRAAQTQALIHRTDVQGRENLNTAHEQVSEVVRETIQRLGGTMPEDLPVARKSIEQVEKEEKRRQTRGMDLFPELENDARGPVRPVADDPPKEGC